MKLILCLIFALSLLWMAGLYWQSHIQPSFMLDVILPPRLLEMSTPEERFDIKSALSRQFPPSILSWVGAIAMGALSAAGFILSFVKKRQAAPAKPTDSLP